MLITPHPFLFTAVVHILQEYEALDIETLKKVNVR